MFIIYVGIDVNSVPIDIREKVVFSKEELAEANSKLNQEKKVSLKTSFYRRVTGRKFMRSSIRFIPVDIT
ncbi:hypothetical protein [Lentilactobacillus rapi]|uniref:hypothetical protein n=1 Tax=Lentilactobacillus rapi TaxID=481723 RepID=UPI000A8EF49B